MRNVYFEDVFVDVNDVYIEAEDVTICRAGGRVCFEEMPRDLSCLKWNAFGYFTKTFHLNSIFFPSPSFCVLPPTTPKPSNSKDSPHDRWSGRSSTLTKCVRSHRLWDP